MTISNKKRIAIIGGGTNTYISNHLALSAPAYGTTAKILENKFKEHSKNNMLVDLYLTKMADQGVKRQSIIDSIKFRKESLLTENHSENNKRIISESIENLEKILLKYPEMDTPQEVEALVDKLIADPDTRVIIFNVAMVDYKPTSLFNLESNAYDAYNPVEITDKFGKYAGRLNTSKLPEVCLELSVQDKIIQKIRKERKDILLVGFKTTCGATKEEQYNKGLKLCKDASANIVFVNDVDKERIEKLNNHLKASDDVMSRHYLNEVKIELDAEGNIKKELWKEAKIKNMESIERLQNNGLITPEESSYWYSTRDEALDGLVQMVLDRSHLHFTRSTVIDSQTIPWQTSRRVPVKIYTLGSGSSRDVAKGAREIIPNPLIPETFRTVFNHIRAEGGWHENVVGKTSGHFGIKVSEYESICSIRKQNYNKIEEVGLVRVITDDPDDVFGYKHFFEENHDDQIKYQSNQAVIAFGAKPSVGDATQRELFKTYPEYDCIIHFHSALKSSAIEEIQIASQFSFECGSSGDNSCSTNTSNNMKEHKLEDGTSVMAVHLDHHGPNIMFKSTANPESIINFIDQYWNIEVKTTGLTQDSV